MLTRCLIRASMVAAATLCSTLGQAAELSATDSTTVTLARGGSNVDTFESLAACEVEKLLRRQADAAERTSGQLTYTCELAQRTVVRFTRPTCPALPAPQGRVVECPAGTTGAYTQTLSYSAAPYPTCAVAGEWVPNTPPPGICVPNDSDNDGVPDSADECPTVHASTPNGCPATPPEPEVLTAPTNVRAQGASTSTIRIDWNAVTGASAYSIERCIGVTCTTFSQMRCVRETSATHTHLPTRITARYRVRASRDTACGTAAGNLGAYSAIVSGTTLSTPAPAPVNCAVSAWSAWNAGSWSTCSGGQQTRSETRTRTVTTQPAHGGTACPALTETRTATQSCSSPATGTATLSWTPPTRNTDGTLLTNLAGYRISYGTNSTALAQTVQVSNPGVSTYTISNLAPGTWYFSVRAYTSGGTDSDQSNVGSKRIQ